MARYFPEPSPDDISLYQIIGHIGSTNTRNHASEIIDLVGRRLYTQNAFMLPCPIILGSPPILETPLHDLKVKKLYEFMLQCNKLIMSPAPFNTSCCLYQSEYINYSDLDLTSQCGSVSSICCHFIDQKRKLCDRGLDQGTLVIPPGVLRGKKYLFAHVTSSERIPVLYFALEVGCANVLSIDSILARPLLGL